jgi:unspecific monooxygenase
MHTDNATPSATPSANPSTTPRADHFKPPWPTLPPKDLSSLAFVRQVSRNGLRVWSRRAYEVDWLEQSFFGRTRVLLNKPECIHHVLVENQHNYRRTDTAIRLLRPLVGDGLLLSTGEDWKFQRRTIAPALGPKMLPLLCAHVAECASEEVEALAARKGEPFVLLPQLQSLALKIAARSMFSLQSWEYGPAVRTEMTRFAERYGRARLLDLVIPLPLPTIADIARKRFRTRWTALVDRIIDARAALPESGGPRDLFDLLRTVRDPETGMGFSRAELRDQVGTMLVAGHETTALTLFWSCYLLASAPREQAAVLEEARHADLSPARAGEASAALPYTRAVVSEALRLYPPAWALSRQCMERDEMPGLAIGKGTMVLISPWVLHRHRAHWTDPDAFDPARFLGQAPPAPRHAYLPFGTGPRVCVGAQFALAEVTLVLARLVQAFDIELADDRPVRPKAIVTTAPDRAVPFRFTPRAIP